MAIWNRKLKATNRINSTTYRCCRTRAKREAVRKARKAKNTENSLNKLGQLQQAMNKMDSLETV